MSERPSAENEAPHDWRPTTNTLAVWKCGRCGAIGFNPHPLPNAGCVIPPDLCPTCRETLPCLTCGAGL